MHNRSADACKKRGISPLFFLRKSQAADCSLERNPERRIGLSLLIAVSNAFLTEMMVTFFFALVTAV